MSESYSSKQRLGGCTPDEERPFGFDRGPFTFDGRLNAAQDSSTRTMILVASGAVRDGRNVSQCAVSKI